MLDTICDVSIDTVDRVGGDDFSETLLEYVHIQRKYEMEARAVEQEENCCTAGCKACWKGIWEGLCDVWKTIYNCTCICSICCSSLCTQCLTANRPLMYRKYGIHYDSYGTF